MNVCGLSLLLVLTNLFASCCIASPMLASAQKRPNIVIILADDMGFNDVSFHGSAQILTPNIDRLAGEGVIFNRFYAQSRCTPSRSALMTGRYPFKIGMQEEPIKPGEPWGLPLSQKILPQYLRDLGYSTHLVGKWHLGEHRPAYLPTNRGFDTFLGTFGGVLDHYDYSIFGKGYGLFNGTQPLRGINATYLPDLTTQWAETVITDRSQSSKPFFLLVATLAPRAAANSKDHLQTNSDYLSRPSVQAIPDLGMIQAVDETVKRVYNALVNSGVENNTLLWFLSDNGGPYPLPGTFTPVPPTSNWPLRGYKGSLYEGGVRVPAVLWASQSILKFTGRISNQLFYIGDLLPTLIAAASGHSASANITGINGVNQWDRILDPSLSDPRSEVLLDIFNQKSEPYFGAIRRNFKVIAGRFVGGLPAANGWLRPLGTTAENPQRLNTSAAVDCNYLKHAEGLPCNSMIAPCLFDLIDDPCELSNLASIREDVLADLLDYVASKNRSYVPLIQIATKHPFDPSLNGGLWGPWLDDKFAWKR